MTCIIAYQHPTKIYMASDTLISDTSGWGYACDSKIIEQKYALIGCAGIRAGYNWFLDYNLPEGFDEDDRELNSIWTDLREAFPAAGYDLRYLMTGGKYIISLFNSAGWFRLAKEEKFVTTGILNSFKEPLTNILNYSKDPEEFLTNSLLYAEKYNQEVRRPFRLCSVDRKL